MLYPLKFKPQLKEVLWGGGRLVAAGKKAAKGVNPSMVGESWELCGLEGRESVVTNGLLKANDIAELTEVYMGELVGDGVYDKYGVEFPLLLKFIDSHQQLSVQVHPTDEFVADEGLRGKTEMWYVVDAAPDSYIYLDWNRTLTEEEFDQAVEEGTVENYLNRIAVAKGDAFLIPAGTVHSIGSGVVVAEVQESSDITYRIYDWNRPDANGQPRELHLDQAAQVVRLTPQSGLRITKHPKTGSAEELTSCDKFTVNLIAIDGTLELDYAPLDSFVAYMCVEGSVTITGCGESETIKELETVLIPAEANDIVLKGKGRLLEIFIK